MATLLTSTSIPCDVIPTNTLYHNSISNSSSYLNNNNNTLNTFSSKLRNSSIDANEVNKKVKDSNNNFVSKKSLLPSCMLNKSMEKHSHKISKGLIASNKNYKTMSNSDINEKNSSNNIKKVDNKKSNSSSNKNLNASVKKSNNSNNNNSNTLKNNNSKIKNKTNIKITSTKIINIQNINTQNPRLQTGNVSRKIINVRNPKKASTRSAVTKLKLPTKDNSNSLSLSKLSINNKNSYNNIKRGNDNNYLEKNFSSYSYNSEFSKKYRVKEEMGRGGFGLVFVAERISDGVEVAIKFIIKEKVPVSAWVKDPEIGIIPRECYLLKHVNHPCIIKYLDCYSDRKYFYLVMELYGTQWSKRNTLKNYQNGNITTATTNKVHCSYINAAALKSNKKFQVGQVRPSMDLFECIESYFECFDEPKARYIFVQLLTAIKYLNSLNIVHRDIKDENILIDKDLNIKLIDFGAAIQIKGGRVYDKFVGTIPYIAPEVITGQEYSSLSQDIYSLGILLYLLIYGNLPVMDLKEEDGSLHLPQYNIKENFCSEEVRHLIRWMLQKAPSARPTLNEIFNHNWIKEKIQ